MFKNFHQDQRGVAAIEFALAATILSYCLFNAIDTSRYAYQSMEVGNAAQVAAQAAWKTCGAGAMLPATQNCSGLNSAIATAIQSTSLGLAVTLASGYPKEGYYCANSSNQLVYVGSLSSKPSDCSSVGSGNASPGDYIEIQATFNYNSLFPSITVISKMASPTISKISWMRLG